MSTKIKAPKWVMSATLLIITMSSIMGILFSSEIISLKTISLGNEYGEYASTSYNPYEYIFYLISIVVDVTIAVMSMVKRWTRFILLGAIFLLLDNIIEFYDYVTLISIEDMRDLLDRFDTNYYVAITESVLFLSGCILLFYNTTVSKPIKIAATAFVVLFTILVYIPFGCNTAYLIFCVLKAVLAITLCFLCYSKSSKVIE